MATTNPYEPPSDQPSDLLPERSSSSNTNEYIHSVAFGVILTLTISAATFIYGFLPLPVAIGFGLFIGFLSFLTTVYAPNPRPKNERDPSRK